MTILSEVCLCFLAEPGPQPPHSTPAPTTHGGGEWAVVLLEWWLPVWAGRLQMLCPWDPRPAAHYLQVCCTRQDLSGFLRGWVMGWVRAKTTARTLYWYRKERRQGIQYSFCNRIMSKSCVVPLEIDLRNSLFFNL